MAQRYDPAEIPASPDLRYERTLWESGVAPVAGLDEAGRGAWAGPVAAGAVILPTDPDILIQLPAVRDSKQMTPPARAVWAEEIKARALAWSIGLATNQEIDALGILPATRLAMQRALDALCLAPAHLLIDAVRLPDSPLPQTSLIKGDARSLSIAAASVLAKTGRDMLMTRLEEAYPGYGFARHKGYGTAQHMAMLQTLGPCPAHRFSFEPLRST